MPVHILDFFNTSQARIVFSIASSPKVWSASRFFTSGIKFATIIFASSKLNENHCRILTVLPRSRFSRLRCAKPTWEHHFFAISRFWPHQNFDSRSGILITCHKVHSRAYGAAKIKRAPWPPEYEFWFFKHLPNASRHNSQNNSIRKVWRAPILQNRKVRRSECERCSKNELKFSNFWKP